MLFRSTKMFSITFSAVLALAASFGLFATDTRAQSGLRFNPGGFAPSAPYTPSNSILDSMPAPLSGATAPEESPAATPAPASEPASSREGATTASTSSAEPAIHQGLSPEKANPAAGLAPVRDTAPASPAMNSGAATDGQNPYMTPRSPGGGLKIR